MTKIKICGITDIRDALLACEYGADAVGFVFAPSPRNISVKKASQICPKLPPFVSKVGVFVNQSARFINNTAKICGLDYVQLHGDESPVFCRKIKVPVIKAFRVGAGFSPAQAARYKVAAVLLDAFCPGSYGGTGRTFDWGVAVRVKKTGLPLILSGGLTPANIASAIRKVGPWAVDLSSGVEKSPGRKNASKMKKAVAIAKRGCII